MHSCAVGYLQHLLQYMRVPRTARHFRHTCDAQACFLMPSSFLLGAEHASVSWTVTPEATAGGGEGGGLHSQHPGTSSLTVCRQ
jgi:hypothetical protein